ncbi:unnamed protein product [Staurois parvus]|uniref:Uncharacterized protein n=1 Tax=Staurois parvus TaxID=386267 RepID=A0ABN9BGX0_9NEOB|nr:unnamed protein product [Staurois parvus]
MGKPRSGQVENKQGQEQSRDWYTDRQHRNHSGNTRELQQHEVAQAKWDRLSMS